ncbi:Zn(II)2Cys6 transcription factor domain-containing protein [Aspergillus tanneri]|uniref:Zn(2)-C6 fungal-type domain-containing protein n=1 Tax=Aspergillus tanneri TaxID=1220188 RepID=A0A5M9N0Q5_9EURO|nr:uncharacterized protein ATNIH1004_000078 [Aspergillus tanneri]KAA8651200.1 hypothetical protein ATNIH1004_000078 [Aspergillus tanneri]
MATVDLVCARCREKKIRCGREKGQCANCRRDGVECNYSATGKRVNHFKLLCASVSSLEDRLNTIEGGMANLLSFGEDDRRASEEGKTSQVLDCHIIRDRLAQTDRYHGPGTLLSLCHQFRTMVIDHLSAVATETAPDSKGQAHQPVWDAIDQQLSSLCTEAGNEKPIFGGKLESISIRLPRITLVRMVELQFFQRYDEVWTICLHIIILLVLGPETILQGSASGSSRSFTHPTYSRCMSPWPVSGS